MSGRARTRSSRQTGQRRNKNVRDSDPKNKKKLKGVPKEGELGTLFDEVSRRYLKACSF
jgi:hypothetical protein